MAKKIILDINFDLIQQIRLAHALSESSFLVVIPRSESSKFILLKDKFGMSFLKGEDGDIFLSKFIKICHEEPSTTIGKLSCPLIFPHAITQYCRTLWRNNREYKYSFSGLLTPLREEVLRRWIKSNITKHSVLMPSHASLFSMIRRKVYSLIGHDATQRKQFGDLMFFSSTRGRHFPIKSWDDQYFDVLSQSQFVLCPSGDYVWSYRFFESILCGAIPIVEKECAVYQGFRFLNFQDNVENTMWSEQDAVYNYNLCLERITLHKDELNEELERLLTDNCA